MLKTHTQSNSATFYALCGLALSLPLIEVTKHLFMLILLALFIHRAITKQVHLKDSPSAKYIIAFLAGSIIASIGAMIKGYNVEKLHDIIRYGLIGLIVLYTPISQQRAYIVLGCLVVATLVGIGDAYYSLYQGKENYFELRSVGHINHSSIYLLLIVGITLPLLLSIKYRISLILLYALVNTTLIYGLLETNSRATFIGLGILIALLVITSALRSKKIACISMTITLLAIAAAMWHPPSALNKIYGKSKYYENKMTPREKAWNAAYHAWKKEPLFGVGYGNYQFINEESMKSWYQDSDINVSDKALFMYLPHAHNRYINTLAEGGAIGLLSLCALLLGFAFSFIVVLKRSSKDKHKLTFWLIGLNSLATVSVVGLFNTTLHHEHGILAMILMCLSLGQMARHKKVSANKTIKKEDYSDAIFITKGKTAPSFRHRLTPLISTLQKEGYNCKIITLDNSWYLWRILKNRRDYKNAKILILHKLLLPKIETKLLHTLNNTTVLDIDDAIYLKEPKWVGHKRPSPQSRKSKFNYMAKSCKIIVAGNDVLANAVKGFCSELHVIPTGVSSNPFVTEQQVAHKVCSIVWIGLPSNLRYLNMLEDVFTELTTKHTNIRIKIICSEFPNWAGINTEKIKWDALKEEEALAESDIGIMPLDDSEYSKGKCAFKLLQYMSAGLPCVASPVGANCDVISDGQNGYLADSTEEWIEKLSFLIENPKQRLAMGAEGRRIAQEQYSKMDMAERYSKIVTDNMVSK